MWKEHFTVSELEFLAEQTLIEIKPLFKKEEIKLLGVQHNLFIFPGNLWSIQTKQANKNSFMVSCPIQKK